MLASQYIYTACGKNRTGAFSVFSKSKDITDEESTEIREVMMYKTPPGLPYEPTPQQIEELFPKKFGYFFLSSGRACLAQVCYVGRVYSELDTRLGNYIIHAFVFEKTDNFAPYSFIEHNTLFKRMLTRKEWHDDPIPDELPQIEIPESGGMLSTNEVTSFFNEDRKNKLKLLIEAVTNSSIETPVCFYDEPKNQKNWFKTLSVCLPKTKQNAVSFCTHFTNTLIPGNISSRIQLRVNQPDSGQFNYTQEVQKGRYAFHFLQNIIPASVKPGKYAQNIVNLLFSGIFEAVKFVDNIDKIMSVYSVNINEASDLINIIKSDYSYFENADEIFNTILIADRVGFETQLIANNLWTKGTQFNFNVQQRVGVFAFIYKNIPTISTRIKIITSIVDDAEQFGIRTDGVSAFRDDLKSKAKFIFENYLDYLRAEGFINYVTKNQSSFLKLFLAFDFLVGLPEVKKSFQVQKNDAPEGIRAVIKIMELAFRRQAISDLDLFINTANSHMNGLGTELLAIIVQETINSRDRIANIQFAFDILKRLRSRTDFAYAFLLHLIKNASDQVGFIKIYIHAQNNEPDFFTKFENANKREPLVIDFFKKKDMFYFENQPLSLQSLKQYFDKYYAIGADTGLFVKRLGEYLYAVQEKKKISECINVLNEMKLPMNADKRLLPPMYCVILETIFSVPYDTIYDFCGKQEWFDKINQIYNAITNAGVGLKQDTRELVIITLCGQIFKKYDSAKNAQILSFFSNTQTDASDLAAYFDIINSNKSINTFIDYYFQPVVSILILGATAEKQFDYAGVLEKVFGKMIEKGDVQKLTDNIVYGAKKSKANPILFILFIFRKRLICSQSVLDKKLGEIAESYFEKISSGERKKIFSELLAFAKSPAENAQFKAYFEEFNKEHKGGLFGFFKKKT